MSGELRQLQVVLFRNQPNGWVAEIPAITGCYALMPKREEALAELAEVFRLIADEYTGRNQQLPAATTAIKCLARMQTSFVALPLNSGSSRQDN